MADDDRISRKTVSTSIKVSVDAIPRVRLQSVPSRTYNWSIDERVIWISSEGPKMPYGRQTWQGFAVAIFAIMAWLGPIRAVSGSPPEHAPEARSRLLRERDRYEFLTAKRDRSGQFEGAIECAEKMFALERQALGEEHRETAGSLKWLADLHLRLGNLDAARAAATGALSILRSLSDSPGRTVDTGEKIVDCQLILDEVQLRARLTESEKTQLKEAADLRRQAEEAVTKKQFQLALTNADRSAELYRQVLGNANLPCLGALDFAGRYHVRASDDRTAEKYFEEVHDRLTQLAGPAHARTVEAVQILMDCLEREAQTADRARKFDELRRVRSRLVELTRARYGEAGWQTRIAELRLSDVDSLERVSPDASQALSLLTVRTDELLKKGPASEAVESARKLVSSCREMFGNEHVVLRAALVRLANAALKAGNYDEAIQAAHEARKTDEKLRILEAASARAWRQDFALELEFAASRLLDADDLDQSKRLIEEKLAVVTELSGPEHSDTLAVHRTLEHLARLKELGPEARKGLVRARGLDDEVKRLAAQRRFDEAQVLAEQAVTMRKQALGDNHPEYAAALVQLASVHINRDEIDQGLSLARRASAIDRAVLGAEHPVFRSIQMMLAHFLPQHADKFLKNAEFAAAVEAFRERALIVHELYGPTDWRGRDAEFDVRYALRMAELSPVERSKLAGAGRLQEMGWRQFSAGHYDESAPFTEQALQMRREVFHDDDPTGPQYRMNLGTVLQRLKKFDAAEASYREALALRFRQSGEEHPKYIDNLSALAELAEEQERFDDAMVLRWEAYFLARTVYGTTDWRTVDLRLAFDRCDDQQRFDAETRRRLSEASDLDRRAGDTYSRRDDAAALDPAIGAWNIRRQIYGESHIETLKSLRMVARIDHGLFNLTRAESRYRDLLQRTRQTLGRFHPFFADALQELADLLVESGQRDEAARLQRELVEIDQQLDPKSGWRTLSSALTLSSLEKTIRTERQAPRQLRRAEEYEQAAINLEQRGRIDDAVESVRKALQIRERLMNPDDAACQRTRKHLTRLLAEIAGARTSNQKYAEAAKFWDEITRLRRSDSKTQEWLVRDSESRAEMQKKLADFPREQLDKWKRAGELERNADAVYGRDIPRNALRQGEEAMEIVAGLFGNDSLAFSNACARQAGRYAQTKQTVNAVVLFRRAAEIQKRKLGPASPGYQSMMEQAALIVQQVSDDAFARKDLQQSIAASEDCLAIRNEYPGPEHPVTLLTLSALKESRQLEALNPAERAELKRARDLVSQGIGSFRQGQPEKALPLQREAVELFRQILGDDSPEYASSLRGLSVVLRKLGRNSEGSASLEESLRAKQRRLGVRHPQCADTLEELCDQWLAAGEEALSNDDVATALENFEKSLIEREKFYPDPNDYRLTYSRLMVVTAQKFSRLNDRERQRVNDARRLRARVAELADAGQFAAAIESADQLRGVREEIWGKEHLLVRETVLLLARLHHDAGSFDQAGPLYEESLDLTRRILGPRRPEDADILEMLGKLYSDLGDRKQAMEHVKEALSIRQQVAFENVGVQRLQTESLQSVANALLIMTEDLSPDAGRELLSSPLQTQLMEMVENLNGSKDLLLADFLLVRARIERAAGEFDLAAEHLDRAAVILRQFGMPEPVIEQVELADARGDQAAAEKWCLQALRKTDDQGSRGSRTERVRVLNRLAEIYEATGRSSEARKSLLRAMRLERQILNLAFGVEKEGGMRAFLEKSGSTRDMLISLSHLHSADDPRAIEDACTWALERKGIEFDALCRVREARALGARDPAIAAKLKRVSELRQRLANLAVKPQIELSPAAQEAELRALQSQVSRTSQEIDQHLASQKNGTPSKEREPAGLDAIRSRLPPRSALVEYVKSYVYRPDGKDRGSRWSEASYFAFVLTSDPAIAPRLLKLGTADDIERLVIKLRDEFSDTSTDLETVGESQLESGFRETSHALYLAIFDEIRSSLREVDTVFVAADGELNQVPFGALSTGEKYLIDDFRFAYLSSGRDLLRPTKSGGKGTVVFADPSYKLEAPRRQQIAQTLVPQMKSPTSSLFAGHVSELRGLRVPRLVETRQEAEFIQTALVNTPLSPVTVYQSDEALEDVLKAQRSPRILHLATHGFFLDSRDWLANESAGSTGSEPAGSSGMARLRSTQNPLLRSGILLAGANAFGIDKGSAVAVDDGVLTAEEVALLDLQGTELVVLSACESGLGEIVAGEGVFGLRRAFQYAGAQSLITSLFKVPDKSTREIMEAFYSSFKTGQSKLSSLHEAQLAVREARRAANGAAHPYFWASFVLIGGPE